MQRGIVCYESNGTDPCPGNLKGVSAISAGEYHNLALLGNGEVVSWGQNTDGQLGNGEEGTALVPETCGANGCSDGPVHVCQVGGPGGSGCNDADRRDRNIGRQKPQPGCR